VPRELEKCWLEAAEALLLHSGASLCSGHSVPEEQSQLGEAGCSDPDRTICNFHQIHNTVMPTWLDEIAAGSTASAVSRLCVAPLDVVKIRFLTQEHPAYGRGHYTNVLQAFKAIYKEEGVLSFWKGNAAAEIMVIPWGAVSFLSYHSCKRILPGTGSLASLTAGAFAGLSATIATYPLDLLRTRFVMQQQHRVYHSVWHAVAHIIRHEGAGGLYVGLSPSLVSVVPFMALQFGAYETLKTAISMKSHQKPTALELGAAGFSAGIFAKLLTMPMDVVKKRFQVNTFDMRKDSPAKLVLPFFSRKRTSSNQPAGGHRGFTGIWNCLRGIVAHEGIRGLFKGTVPSLLKAGPNSAITFVVYDSVFSWLHCIEHEELLPPAAC